MKLLALLGSPRRKGNTATLLNAFLKGVEDMGGAEIKYVNLHEKTLKTLHGFANRVETPLFKVHYQ